MKKRLLSLALILCISLSLLPTTALAAAPSAPTNLRIEVGDLYQTLPCLIWDKVEGATTYDIRATDVDGKWVESGGTTQNHYFLGANNTQTSVGFRVIANNEDGEPSEPATLEGINLNVNKSTSPAATAIHNVATLVRDGYYDTNNHLYTITGLPANATCRLNYKFYDPAKNGGVSFADNTKEKGEMEFTQGIQSYEINAYGVLVIGIESADNVGEYEDWNGLADGVVNTACDEYSLTVTSSCTVSEDGTTVYITQKEISLYFQDYSGPATTQSVSFAQERITGVEFGTPYTQTATHKTGDGWLVYYSMYAAIKKVNPTSGEVVGWRRNESDTSGEITVYAAATANYPAALARYDIRFVEPSNAPKNIQLAFDTGDTNPGLKWTASEGTWTGYNGKFFTEKNDSTAMAIMDNSTVINGPKSVFTILRKASFGKTGALEETRTYKKAEIKLTGASGDSAIAAFDMNFTSTQTVSATPLTAVYTGSSAEDGLDNCAHFSISGVPANKSMEIVYRYPTNTEYDGTSLTNTYHLSSEAGSYSFFDVVYSSDPDGELSLSDLDVDTGDYYYLVVYDGTVTNDTTGSAHITIYPLEFIFDSRDPQELSWSAASPLNITYGDTGAGLKANNSTIDGGEITYSSNNENIATVANDGKITTVGAGECTITATAAATGMEPTDYRETSISYTLTVAKKDVNVTANNASRSFGEANPAFSIADPSAVLVSGDTEAALGVTLSTTATKASNAGTYDITGTSTSANYNVTVTPGTLTVGKANAPTVENISKYLLNSQSHSDVNVNIIGLPSDCGITSFTVGTVTGDAIIFNGAVTDTATGIKFSTNTGSENQTATIPVKVTMQNYEDVIVNVVVTLVDKTPVTITGVAVADKTYDGAAAAYTGTPANEQGYDGTYEYIWSSDSAPKNVGSYTLMVKIPDDNENFMGEVEIQFTISKKAMTVKPRNLSIYKGAALPSFFELEYVGIVSGDTVIPSGTPEFVLKNGAEVLANSSTNGTYTIEWTNKADVTVEHQNYVITKGDGTLTISSKPSNDSGGSSSTPPTPPTPTATGGNSTTTNGNTAVTTSKVEATVNSSGTAVSSVNADSMKSLIESAKNSEKEDKNAVIEIQVAASASAKGTQVMIPRQSMETIAGETSADLRINTATAVLTFDNKAISAISEAATGDIQMSVQTINSDSLPASAKAQVGNRPVYDFTVMAGSKQVSGFNGGSVGVSIPYTPAAGEDISAIVIYYLGDNGELETVTNGHYDAATGTVEFSVSHFSTYAVGYNKKIFTDVSDNAWYGKAVTFLAAREVTAGTSATTYSPEMKLTRGEFITLLLRAYGIKADYNSTDNFSDAGNNYFTGYLAAAKKLGITSGVGDNLYAPGRDITRQEMFTLVYNTLKAINKLPEGNNGKYLSSFSDAKDISSWATEAMKLLVETNTIEGSGGKLLPKETTTRAQMAQLLFKLLSK